MILLIGFFDCPAILYISLQMTGFLLCFSAARQYFSLTDARDKDLGIHDGPPICVH